MYEVTFEYADGVTLTVELKAGDEEKAIDRAFGYAESMVPDADPVNVSISHEFTSEVMAYLEN